jgi:hypothetical protein
MAPAELVEAPKNDNAADVEAWRLHVLLRAGYPLRVAERLAKSAADLHIAVDILDRGCTPHTAARILV